MFPLGVRSDVSKSISNEFRCNFRLDSLLILLLTSLLTPVNSTLFFAFSVCNTNYELQH
jgi:hypothetical protein